MDYEPNSETTKKFFKVVQNKLHFAAHGQTAAETIYHGADSNKEFMGLKTFTGKDITKKDVTIAKNYLDENDLKKLNTLVSGYFDFAELQAMNLKPMKMKDYIDNLDKILGATDMNILQNAGSISTEQAKEKALEEYKKYQAKTLSSIEKNYLETIKQIEKKIKEKKTK